MTQHIEHHEDVATITVHFHEDELLELARLLSPALSHQRITLPKVRLANAAIRRVTSAADGVLHAGRAKRRAPKV